MDVAVTGVKHVCDRHVEFSCDLIDLLQHFSKLRSRNDAIDEIVGGGDGSVSADRTLAGLPELRTCLFVVGFPYLHSAVFIAYLKYGFCLLFNRFHQPVNLDDQNGFSRCRVSGVIKRLDGFDSLAVRSLEYEAYAEMAEKKMAQIGEEVRQKFPIGKIAIIHRLGQLDIGESSIIIAVAAPHRHEAFEACAYAMDRVKEEVPIWKKEFFTDGNDHWVNQN